MDEFLRSTDVIDWHHPAVRARAESLRAGAADADAVVRCCFEWVRDEIRHTTDFALEVVAVALLRIRLGHDRLATSGVPSRQAEAIRQTRQFRPLRRHAIVTSAIVAAAVTLL